MHQAKLKRAVILLLISLLVFLLFYSWFFRRYLEPQQYLDLAWEHIPYEPDIVNYHNPDFALLWQGLKPTVRLSFTRYDPVRERVVHVLIDVWSKEVTSEQGRP